VSEDERPLLAPVIGPLAAVIIDRELGATLRRRARDLAALGQVDASRQLASAAAQLSEAARQLMERTSAAGSPEVPPAPASAESGSPWWSTSVVAEKLGGISARQVRYLVDQGRLSAITVSGRKLIDPLSVAEEQARRRGDGWNGDSGEDPAGAGGDAVQGRRAG
jgi:hypothetical protein